MGGRGRPKKAERTDEWKQIGLLCAWPEQARYEVVRPLVFFGNSVAKLAERMLYRRMSQFEAEAMESLFDLEKARRRRLPPAMRRLVVDPKTEHSALNFTKIAAELGRNERTALEWVGRFYRHGVAGLAEVLRGGHLRVYGPEEVGVVIQASLTPPRELGLPFASWTLNRLVAYLKEEKGVGVGRTMLAEVFSADDLR